MTKETEFERNVFKEHFKEILEITDHLEDCEYYERLFPVNEGSCYCYERQIFLIGRKAEKDLFMK